MKTKRRRFIRKSSGAPQAVRAKKSLGQHFLMHASIAERIADAAGISGSDVVLEIGPGTGMLTAPLLARAKKVIAVEADHELVLKLRERFASELRAKALELIEGDVRALSISIRSDKEADTLALPRGYKLVANIPYYLTGDIIRTFLSATRKPVSITLLVQKEVAERMARAKKESLLSVAVKAYGEPHYLFTVPKGAFVPQPAVDSAVISITDIHRPFASVKQESRFFELARAGFAHKRKLLAKNLEIVADKSAIEKAFTALSIPKKARAEDLPAATWHLLAAKVT
jgi:16S rRNA (adenine1518-N6/adenine1519-N6)-dimethyltransferase